MASWKRLESDLTVWLRSFERPGIEYRNPHQAIPGLPANSFMSDGLLTDGRTLLALEVEAGQMHPDTNVGKYWYLVARHHAYERVILFHVYTPDFNSYPWRKALGEFYAEAMGPDSPVEYIQFDLRDLVDYDAALAGLKAVIEPRLRQAFAIPG